LFVSFGEKIKASAGISQKDLYGEKWRNMLSQFEQQSAEGKYIFRQSLSNEYFWQVVGTYCHRNGSVLASCLTSPPAVPDTQPTVLHSLQWAQRRFQSH